LSCLTGRRNLPLKEVAALTQTTTPYVRPNFLITRLANPVLRRLSFTPALIVRGRRSGRTVTTPMAAPFEFEGQRYVVSGRGSTQWVRNLRAAGHASFRIHGRPEPFRAVEIGGPDRQRVLAAYRAKLGHSVEGYFREIPDPADHPVFRMDAFAPERATY
jgi:hypothetical protein